MHELAHLSQIVTLLAAAVSISTLFRLMGFSSVLGYLAAGMWVGPYGLSVIKDVSEVSALADFGLIFLLFVIGLELSWARLRSLRKPVFGLGSAQMLLTGAVLTLGLLFVENAHAHQAWLVGLALAMSSTAITLQVTEESGEKSSQVGRLAIAVLILQDLAVIPLLAAVTFLADGSGAPLETHAMATLLHLGGGLLALIVFTRLIVPPLLRMIARLGSHELFSATTLLLALSLAWASQMLGLPLEFGAFVAGMAVAETEFRPQVEADILPFKTLLLGLFFMTVGMTLDLDLIARHLEQILGFSLLLMAVKAALLALICRLLGFSSATSIQTGFLLSQGGEFAFVLFDLAGDAGLLRAAEVQHLLAVIGVSMALTPFAAMLGKKLAALASRQAIYYPLDMAKDTLDLQGHVIITGFGRVGRTVARLLAEEDILFVALDADPQTVTRERRQGQPLYYGDASRPPVLQALGIMRARAAILTHGDARISEATIRAIRAVNPEIPIIARARNLEQVLRLEQVGADIAVAEMFETSLQLGGALLRKLGVAEHEISRILDMFRAGDYALTRGGE